MLAFKAVFVFRGLIRHIRQNVIISEDVFHAVLF